MQTEGPNSANKEVAEGVKVKKEKSAEQGAELESQYKGGTEMDDLWVRVKKEIKEEIEPDLSPSNFDEATPVQEVGVKEEIEEEQHQDLAGYHSEVATDERVPEQAQKTATVQTPAEPEPKPVTKRRRLTRRDMQEAMQTDGSKSAKKEFADGVKVKKEKSAEQEADLKSPATGGMEMDDLWVRVKKEIKEEIEPDLSPSNFDEATPVQEVGVKEEIEEEQHQDLAGYHSEVATDERVPEQAQKTATVQTPAEPEPKPVTKRRRLTRRDMQEAMQTDGSKSAKKEFADGVKVKREKTVESRQEGRMEMDDLWLQVRKEINRHASETSASSSTRGDDATPAERDSISHPKLVHQKVEPSAETDKSDGQEDRWRVRHALIGFLGSRIGQQKLVGRLVVQTSEPAFFDYFGCI